MYLRPIQEPVAVTVNLVQELLSDIQAVGVRELRVQASTVQTPVTLHANAAKILPPSSILTAHPTEEAPLKRERKRP